MIRGERRRWRTDSLTAGEGPRWRWLGILLLWAALYGVAALARAHSYFVIGSKGDHIIPQGLFDSEKHLLMVILDCTFAIWLLGELLRWRTLSELAGRVTVGIAAIFVPAMLVMSWPALLRPFLPAGVHTHEETRLNTRYERPVPLFKGDPLVRRRHLA